MITRDHLCEIHVAAAPSDTFYSRIMVLAASIRRFGGALAESPIVISVSRDQEPVDLERELPWSRRYGIEWRWIDPELYTELDFYGTALIRLTYDFATPYVVLLDADTICTGRLDELTDHAERRIAGVIAYRPPFGGGSAEQLWDSLFRDLGLPPQPLACEHPGWGQAYGRHELRACPPYFNFGVIALESEVANRLGEVVLDELRLLNRSQREFHRFFRAQLAVTMAIARTGVDWAELPIKFNIPNHEKVWQSFPDAAEDVRMLHYLMGEQIDRDAIFATRQSLASFLSRRDLSPSNALLQARVAELREEIEPMLAG